MRSISHTGTAITRKPRTNSTARVPHSCQSTCSNPRWENHNTSVQNCAVIISSTASTARTMSVGTRAPRRRCPAGLGGRGTEAVVTWWHLRLENGRFGRLAPAPAWATPGSASRFPYFYRVKSPRLHAVLDHEGHDHLPGAAHHPSARAHHRGLDL